MWKWKLTLQSILSSFFLKWIINLSIHHDTTSSIHTLNVPPGTHQVYSIAPMIIHQGCPNFTTLLHLSSRIRWVITLLHHPLTAFRRSYMILVVDTPSPTLHMNAPSIHMFLNLHGHRTHLWSIHLPVPLPQQDTPHPTLHMSAHSVHLLLGLHGH